MKIVLINKSPVVSELLAYALRDTKHSYKEIDTFEHLSGDFDLIILDDPFLNNNIYLEYVENKPCIILSTKHLVDNYANLSKQAKIVQKPFLPKDILEVINSLDNELKTAILDKEEVGKIQQLLGGNENNQELENEADSCKYVKSKKKYKDNISYIFDKNLKTKEKELLNTILDMKPKKLKKFLKNSNIRLNIEIKE
ncbi:MAG: hypothetical protein PHI79_01815 [Sulfurovaceae bacterium]|nr:hypothetical protein [Sulfurovaceae bacterium]MDD5548311.1 hypothetical protein [Sulfurovaceae bacterium]